MARAFVPHTITSDSALGGSVIDHSIRFNRGDNPHFSRTPSGAGNRRIWTYSVWLKRTDFGERSFFQAYDGSSSRRFQLSFANDDTLNFNQGGNSSSGLAGSYMMFRDPTAWYHIVAVADYKNSTAADRFKVYVNGSQIDLNITDSIEDADGQCNGAFEHEIGAVGSSNSLFDGYMADINFIDGQALDPSYFGYTEFQTKVWRPKSFIAKGPNNGTTWSGNVTASNFSSNSATSVFDGNFSGTSATINSSDASNNHITLSSVNVVASKVGVVLSNSSSDVQVYVNGSLVGTAAGGDIINNNPKHFEFTFTQTTVSTIKVQRVSSTSGWQIYGVSLNGITLIDGDVSNVGRNGFKLDFRDFSGDSATTIGRDYSGNGNNFSPDNFGGTGDGAIDSPTNNFTSFNKIMDYSLNADITEAGLRVEGPDSGHNDRRIYAPFAIPLTGKYYVEVKCVKNGARGTIGFSDGAINGGGNGSNWFSFGFYGGGYSTSFTKVGSNTSDFNLNDYVSFALDMDAGKMWLVKNGNVDVTAQESITAIVRTNLDRPLRWFYQETASDESAALFNFGQFPYNYTVPDGFKTLSSRNIQPTYFRATNQPVKTFLDPKNHFHTLLYTGNDSSDRNITGLEFKPDFVWIKNRSQSDGHQLVDSVRGANKTLFCNSNVGESTNNSNGHVNYFTSGGFNVDAGAGGDVNENSENYVAWCWKAGGASVTNNDGTIATQVSANQQAGFSIVTYTGTGADGTIGHGLGKVPGFVIIKNRDRSVEWIIKHHKLNSGHVIYLNEQDTQNTASGSNNGIINDLDNASTLSLSRTSNSGNYNNVSVSGEKYVAYCWAEIPGYSKFGSYIGNGSTNGVYVHLGFRPAWILYKCITESRGYGLADSVRTPYNQINRTLFPDSSGAEYVASGSNDHIQDFYCDGFKLRNTNNRYNSDGQTYVYMAFAEQPGITTYGSSPTAR